MNICLSFSIAFGTFSRFEQKVVESFVGRAFQKYGETFWFRNFSCKTNNGSSTLLNNSCKFPPDFGVNCRKSCEIVFFQSKTHSFNKISRPEKECSFDNLVEETAFFVLKFSV